LILAEHPIALVADRAIPDRHLTGRVVLHRHAIADILGADAGKQVMGGMAGDRHHGLPGAEKSLHSRRLRAAPPM